MYDYGARYYDPVLGRWHSQDPLIAYASPYNGIGNNPVNLIDRWGMCPFNAEGGGGGGSYSYGYGYQSPCMDNGGTGYSDGGSSSNGGSNADAWYNQDVFNRNKTDANGNYITPMDRPGGPSAIGYGSTTTGHYESKTYSGYNYTIHKDGTKSENHYWSYSVAYWVWDDVGNERSSDNSGLTGSEQIELGYRNYGGDYSGSLEDYTYFIADQLNQLNPIAIVWDYLTYLKNGTDRFGNPVSDFDATLSVAMIFIGGVKLEKEVWHRSIKPTILDAAGNYERVVGTNPNITLNNGKIILEGQGPYTGKSFATGLNFNDFLDF